MFQIQKNARYQNATTALPGATGAQSHPLAHTGEAAKAPHAYGAFAADWQVSNPAGIFTRLHPAKWQHEVISARKYRASIATDALLAIASWQQASRQRPAFLI